MVLAQIRDRVFGSGLILIGEFEYCGVGQFVG